MQTRFKRIVLVVVSSLVLATLSQPAFGHATPLQYVPEASSILSKAPMEVQIRFSERVEPRVSSITVFGPNGSRVDLPDGGADKADPRIYRVGVKDGGQGTYTVSWQVISADDGHFAKGAYAFSVGVERRSAATESGGFQTVHSSGVPEALTLALELIGDALILGALIVFAFIWRPMRKQFPEAASEEATFTRRFQAALITGSVLALAGSLAYLVYKINELATLQETTFAAAWSPFITTTAALYTIYRMLGVVFVLIIFQVTRKQIFAAQRITKSEYALFGALVLIDLARARVSHAAASTFAPGLGVLMNFVHLVFKDVWIGGIIALVVLCAPLVKKVGNVRVAAFALTAFSRISSIALGVAGVTGVYVVWLHLKSLSNVLTTDWGKRFVVLSVFAGFLLLLRLFHQLYLEPKITKAIKTKDETRRKLSFRWLGFTLPAEMTIGIAILSVTSLLIITTPPLVPHYRFVRSATSQGVALSLTQQPNETGTFLVTAEDPATKTGANVSRMVVALTNQAAGIGPIIAPVEERFLGGFVFDEKLLAPAGTWTVNIAAQRAGGYDATASFDLKYPEEINDSIAHAGDRTFGSFEAMNIAAALIVFIASFILYRWSTKLNREVLSAGDTAPDSPPLSLVRPGAWFPPVIVIVVVLALTGGFPAIWRGVLESPFQRACEDANVMDVWHESVPVRAGKATSDLALPGCTVGIGLGQYHFTDGREFAFFARPPRARAQLAINPAVLAPNVSATLTFTLQDYQGHPVQDLVLDHNRIMHVVIASKDFSVFAHIHSEDLGPITPAMVKAAVFPVRYTFPKPGHYMIAVDFTERAYIFSDQFYVNVGQTNAMGGPPPADFALHKTFDGYDVTLKTSPSVLKAGAPATLDYHIEKDGKPVTDMNPYLAVPMHLSIIHDDLMGFLHTHGLLPVSFIGKLLGESIHASHLFLPDKFGPDIEVTNFAFQSPGIYYIFGEFSVAGKIVVTQFTVKVE